MKNGLPEWATCTFAIGIVPRELYLQFKDDVYALMFAAFHFDWHTAAIMYASLNPPWGKGKFERKATTEYLANHKIRKD